MDICREAARPNLFLGLRRSDDVLDCGVVCPNCLRTNSKKRKEAQNNTNEVMHEGSMKEGSRGYDSKFVFVAKMYLLSPKMKPHMAPYL